MEKQYEIKRTEISGVNGEAPINGLLVHLATGTVFSERVISGPEFSYNARRAKEHFLNPKTGETIPFRLATTKEAILWSGYEFPKKLESSLPRDQPLKGLCYGLIAEGDEGFYINPPMSYIGDKPYRLESQLVNYLSEAKKENGIWIVPNEKFKKVRDFSFVPYESVGKISPTDFIDTKDFIQGGLGRGLAHNQKDALKILEETVSHFGGRIKVPHGIRRSRGKFDKMHTHLINLNRWNNWAHLECSNMYFSGKSIPGRSKYQNELFNQRTGKVNMPLVLEK